MSFFCVALVWMGLLASRASAQAPARLGVVLSDGAGLSDRDLGQFQAGVEQIISDYGGFELVGWDQVAGALDASERRSLTRCGTDASCLAGLLYPLDVDLGLHFRIDPDAQGLVTTITGLNFRDGRVETVQDGFLPGSADTMFLLVPIHEALGVMATVDVQRGVARATEPRQETRRTDGQDQRRDEPELREEIGEPGGTNVLAMSLEIGGAAVMATGIVFWVLADDTLQEIQAEPHPAQEVSDLQSKGDTYQLIGNIAVATGAVVMVTGLVFDLLKIGAPRSGGTRSADNQEWRRFGLSPIPAGASIRFEMDF
ncbi:MAG: hypothetical protein JW797_09575 [Bradymonadales bacterium]|nr:hypothetical protein [Bradymonadales bacterium]